MKRIRNRQSNIIRGLVCLLLVVMLIPAALAYTAIDTNAETSLTLIYGFSDVSFRVYKIADVSERVKYALSGDFVGYPVDIGGIESNNDWLALAETLSAYAARDNLMPMATGTISADGTLAFSSLETGLYLVVGEQHKANSNIYTPTPFIISLPNLLDTDEWNYDVVVKVKNSFENDYTFVDRTVVKVWNDSNSSRRPSSVTVQLLQNGSVYDEVTLDSGNNWQYTWEDLSTEYIWQVTETSVPSRYTVRVTQEGTYFYISNTYSRTTTDPSPSPSTSEEVTPSPSASESPTTSESPPPSSSQEPPTSPSEPSYERPDPPTPATPGHTLVENEDGTYTEFDEDGVPLGKWELNEDGEWVFIPEGDTPLGTVLPQTGVLQWPIPVLAGLGLVSFGGGWYLSYGKKKDNNE